MNTIPSITVTELAELMHRKSDLCLIDVREPDEHAAASIAGSQLVPLATVPEQASQWSRDQAIYLHCKAGGRSARAAQYLSDQGFTQVTNVSGGMDAWQSAGLPVT
ncbi:MAG: rhodanese-like domain-containing protein [Akkermansiaceae bacterium]